jgi:hypothetical protein
MHLPRPTRSASATRRAWLLRAACVALAGAASHVPAAEVAPADAKRIRAVIEDQLAAFAADDAARAFGHASASLQRRFGSADRFLAMVRSAYPVVHRPAAVAFLRPELVDGQWNQGVHLTDARGERWLAVYVMERQPDRRHWRIASCTLVPAPGQTA